MNRDYFVISNTLRNWFPKPIHINFPVSVDDPLIIKYRMTLGSIYYSSKKQETIMNLPKDPNVGDLGLTINFLKTHHPNVLSFWQVIKKETEQHLKYIENLWQKYLIHGVNGIISSLKTKYPELDSYSNSKASKSFYVRDNILECLYREIEHIALTGNELGLFQRSEGKVGNGFLFLKSSNEEILTQFMDLLKKTLYNENAINDFRNAEIKKADVESKVLDFKEQLQNIVGQLEYSESF